MPDTGRVECMTGPASPEGRAKRSELARTADRREVERDHYDRSGAEQVPSRHAFHRARGAIADET